MKIIISADEADGPAGVGVVIKNTIFDGHPAIGRRKMTDRKSLVGFGHALADIEGLSYEEIADVMNCPIGTVRSRIFRAREAIAEKLRPLLGTSEENRW